MSTIAPHRQLLTVRQVSERLAVSEKTIRRLIDQGELPALRVGAQIRIAENELDAWLFRNVDGSSSPSSQDSVERRVPDDPAVDTPALTEQERQ